LIAGEKKATILLLFSKKEPKKSPFLSKNSVIFGDLATFFCVFCNALDCAGESCTAKLLTAEAEHDTGRAIGFVSVCSFAVLGPSGRRQSLVEPALGSVGSCWWWAVPVVGAVRHDAEAQKSRVFHNRMVAREGWLPSSLHSEAQNKRKGLDETIGLLLASTGCYREEAARVVAREETRKDDELLVSILRFQSGQLISA
jgi:hypothetical protein